MILEFEPPDEPLSMNDGNNKSTWRTAAAWRDRAYYAWCEAHPGQGPAGRAFPPATVHVTLPFPRERRRDPINYARTVKHIVDGIRMAGAWPDDTPDWVDQQIPTLIVTTSLPVLVRVEPRAST